MCEPVTLTAVPENGLSITLDADNVYFTNDRALYSCPKTGCTSPTHLADATNSSVLYADAGGNGYLYLTSVANASNNAMNVGQYALNGDLLSTLLVTGTVGQMDTDGVNVYIGLAQGLGIFPIAATPLTYGMETGPNWASTVATLHREINGIQYVANVADSATITRITAGGAMTTYSQNQATPVSIAATSDYVYWANLGTYANSYNDGEVFMCAAGPTCTAPVKVFSAPSCSSVTLDSTNFYFQCFANLYKCPLSGCGSQGPVELAGAALVQGPTLANDATALYWITEYGSTVMKLAK
jgi:hypothetical protein